MSDQLEWRERLEGAHKQMQEAKFRCPVVAVIRFLLQKFRLRRDD
jgi:hypothetical protein